MASTKSGRDLETGDHAPGMTSFGKTLSPENRPAAEQGQVRRRLSLCRGRCSTRLSNMTQTALMGDTSALSARELMGFVSLREAAGLRG
jgi:hypothetical protein